MKKMISIAAFLLLAALPGTQTRVEYTANGTSHVFNFTFKTISTTHVEVYLNGSKQTSGYSVTLNPSQDATPGGSVAFLTPQLVPFPPAAGTVVRIQRVLPLTQDTVYNPYSAFPAKLTETTFDKTVMMAQQLDATLDDVVAGQCLTCQSASSTDTLDGIDSLRFVHNQWPALSTNSTDFNAVTQQGIYQVTGDGTWTGSTNGPTAAYGFGLMEVLTNGGNVTTQRYVTHQPSTTWIRSKLGPADWQAWRGLWDNLNDGIGSGLDADLLDGLTTSSSGDRWGTIPYVENVAGVIEIGRYIDFHSTDADAGDFTARLEAPSAGNLSTSATLTVGDLVCTNCLADSTLTSNYSGVGACGANQWASTLNDNAAPTCTQPAFSNLSGTATDAQLASNYSGVGACAAGQAATTLNDNAAPTCSNPKGSKILGTTAGAIDISAIPPTEVGALAFNHTAGSTGFPSTVGVALQVDRADGGTASANGSFRLWSANDAPANSLYFMRFTSGSGWTTYKLWNDGNDGPASGLNADLLDGISSTSFSGVGACAAGSAATTLNGAAAPTCSTLYYQTVKDEGNAQTQDIALNFVGQGVTCAPGEFGTECAIPGVSVADEAVALTYRNTINFTGSGVTCSDNGVGGRTDCSIPGSGVPWYQTVKDETTALTQRTSVNFTGAGVSCADNGGTSTTDCTVGNIYGTVQDEGTARTQRGTINFVGGAVSCVDNAGSSRTDCTVTDLVCVEQAVWSAAALPTGLTSPSFTGATAPCQQVLNVTTTPTAVGWVAVFDMDQFTHCKVIGKGGATTGQTGGVNINIWDYGTSTAYGSWSFSGVGCSDSVTGASDMTSLTGKHGLGIRITESVANDDPQLSNMSVQCCNGAF